MLRLPLSNRCLSHSIGSFSIGRLCAMVLGLLMLDPGVADAAKKTPAKQPPKPRPELVISPNPVVLMDVQTGNVLYHQDANRKWYPASLTKLMTAYVTFRAIEAGEISEESALSISEHALAYPASKMGFRVGTQLTVGNALKMVIVKSANDIAAALGERISGSEAAFADRMNREAARLGMTATRFINANGLYSPLQTSSARDMAILTRQILLEFPQHRPLFQIPAIRHGKRVLRSYNKLLETFSGTDGMKTGFVCSSGYNIVASATRNERQLVAVVLGAPNPQIRAESAAFLLSQGFDRADMSGGAGVPIVNEAAFGARAEPEDMRPEICPRGAPRWAGYIKYKTSYLEPRFRLMDPVRVYAGISRKRIVLPEQLAQLPLQGPREKIAPIKDLTEQKGQFIRLAQLPRPKP